MDKNRITHGIKLIFVFVAGIMPCSLLRKFFYRIFFGYKIASDAYIGYLNFIDVKEFRMGKNTRLNGILNIMTNVTQVEMEPHSKMGAVYLGLNLVSGQRGETKLLLKQATRVSWGHFFDLHDNITIGEMTIIGGKSCEFFTHDVLFGKRFAPIEIGAGCYIASSSKFKAGSKISDHSVVAMGAVVSKKFDVTNILVGGVPAKIIRENYGYNAKKTYDDLELPHQ